MDAFAEETIRPTEPLEAGAFKRLVVCCDGTWNDPDTSRNFTNVVRLARAVRPTARVGTTTIHQLTYYHPGVGTGLGLFDRYAGGALGLGLSRNVRDAYAFIARNYRPGDEIVLIGFSRGAYTARSVAGLIGWAGVIQKPDLDDFVLLWEAFRLGDAAYRAETLAHFETRHRAVPIQAVAVFDTVGAYGIPHGFGPNPVARSFAFSDRRLRPHVRNGFQALALDEHRADFVPCLWERDPEADPREQRLEQVWFAGAHSNVGGGYDEHGSSDVSLAWMASRLDPLIALDVTYLQTRQDQRDEWACGRLVDSRTPLYRLRPRLIRKVKLGHVDSPQAVHSSVVERQTRLAYRPLQKQARHARVVSPMADLETRLQWTGRHSGRDGHTSRPAPKHLTRTLRRASLLDRQHS